MVTVMKPPKKWVFPLYRFLNRFFEQVCEVFEQIFFNVKNKVLAKF